MTVKTSYMSDSSFFFFSFLCLLMFMCSKMTKKRVSREAALCLCPFFYLSCVSLRCFNCMFTMAAGCCKQTAFRMKCGPLLRVSSYCCYASALAHQKTPAHPAGPMTPPAPQPEALPCQGQENLTVTIKVIVVPLDMINPHPSFMKV